MNTEQALIEMIQNPGKKFTNGHDVAYYGGASICLEMSSVPVRLSLSGFLTAFAADTWTEHKEFILLNPVPVVEMDTEQALIAMIKNPGKKFTNGHDVAYYEGECFRLEVSSVPGWSLCGFLTAFAADTWTEHKEPRVVEFEGKLRFDSLGIPDLDSSTLVEQLGGPTFAADTEWNLKVTAKEVTE